jgi:hypothetical protein
VRLLGLACLLLWVQSLSAQPGCIEGVVRDTAGAGIYSVHVIGVGRNFGFDVPTERDGSFRAVSIPAGAYQVIAAEESRAKPRAAEVAHVTAATDGTCSSLTLHLPTRARLHITATDLLTAAAIPSPGAGFRLGEHSYWQGVLNRQQELFVPPSTDLEVLVGAFGYENSVIKASSLNPGEVRDLEAHLRPVQMGCIMGTVVDEQGAPVSGIRIEANLTDPPGAVLLRNVSHVMANGVVTTDSNGQFRFRLVQPGEYSIYAHGERLGYVGAMKRHTLVVPPGAGCAGITIEEGPKAGKLRLTVVDAVTQKPLSKYYLSASTQPSPAGWFSPNADPMLLPPLQAFAVTVKADGYQEQTLEMPPLQPEEVRTVNVALQPSPGGGRSDY